MMNYKAKLDFSEYIDKQKQHQRHNNISAHQRFLQINKKGLALYYLFSLFNFRMPAPIYKVFRKVSIDISKIKGPIHNIV